MTTPLRLPYFRNHEDLPAPLQTTSETLASNDIIKGIEAWATRKVVGVGEHFIVKYSPSNDQIEGENLLFLERKTFRGFVICDVEGGRRDSIPRDGTFTFDMLESLWLTLQGSDKDHILAKTHAILIQIRTTPHRGFFGSVDQSHMPHHFFYWPNYPAHISCPFTAERVFIQALISKSRSNARDNGRHSYLADFFKEQLMRGLVVDGRTPVVTHSDLQRKNILAEEVEGAQDQKEFRVSLVDWESAGWYPVYWEYFVAFLSFTWNDDWCTRSSL
jgi:hypothetical protein